MLLGKHVSSEPKSRWLCRHQITLEIKTCVGKCHNGSVQLYSTSCSKEALHTSILEVFPQGTWDPSSLAFLHDSDHRFSGYVKLDRRMLHSALTGWTDSRWEDIYLAWGGLDLTDSAERNSIRETVWVRLYWAREGEVYPDLKSQMFADRDSDDSSGLERDSIRRGSEAVKAKVISIGDFGSECFRIDIRVSSRR
jgi:hypothetical protein